MKNNLNQLNNALFEMLEQIMDPEEGQNIDETLRKAKVVSDIGKTIIASASVQLDSLKICSSNAIDMSDRRNVPEVLLIGSHNG